MLLSSKGLSVLAVRAVVVCPAWQILPDRSSTRFHDGTRE